MRSTNFHINHIKIIYDINVRENAYAYVRVYVCISIYIYIRIYE